MFDYDYLDEKESVEIKDINVEDPLCLHNTSSNRELCTCSSQFYSGVIKDCLDSKQEQELVERIKRGDKEAYEEFINRNIKFVFYVVNNLLTDSISYDYDDAIQEGILGLMRAIESFDPSKGKFSTYAVHWIRSYISRAQSQKYSSIRVPVYIGDLSKKIYSIKKQHQENGESISDDALKKQLGLTEKEFKLANKNVMMMQPRSLNEVVISSSHTPIELGDTIQSECQIPEELVIKQNKYDILHDAISQLSPKEQQVIVENFGLNGSEAKNIRDISQEMGVSYQRIGFLRQSAIQKLQRMPRLRTIVD